MDFRLKALLRFVYAFFSQLRPLHGLHGAKHAARAMRAASQTGLLPSAAVLACCLAGERPDICSLARRSALHGAGSQSVEDGTPPGSGRQQCATRCSVLKQRRRTAQPFYMARSAGLAARVHAIRGIVYQDLPSGFGALRPVKGALVKAYGAPWLRQHAAARWCTLEAANAQVHLARDDHPYN